MAYPSVPFRRSATATTSPPPPLSQPSPFLLPLRRTYIECLFPNGSRIIIILAYPVSNVCILYYVRLSQIVIYRSYIAPPWAQEATGEGWRLRLLISLALSDKSKSRRRMRDEMAGRRGAENAFLRTCVLPPPYPFFQAVTGSFHDLSTICSGVTC